LRSALRDFFPAALKAFPDLDAPDALELLAKAPDPERARRPTKSQITAALPGAHRRDIDTKATQIQQILRADELHRSTAVRSAYAAIVTGQVALVQTLNTQIDEMGAVVDAHFGRHPNAEIYASQPGLGAILAARVLGEFGDDPHRYNDAKARKSHAGTAPITRASGKRKIVLARYARNRRLGDALQQWAFCSLRGSPGARVYYQQLRDRNIGHQAALRQVANRLVGILHGCLKTHTPYNEHTARGHHMTGVA
jgi:transposase